jgi:hypothetical protein
MGRLDELPAARSDADDGAAGEIVEGRTGRDDLPEVLPDSGSTRTRDAARRADRR